VTAVHVVVPEGVDDPARASGGNVYDRQVCEGLAASGWTVREHVVAGCWPRPDPPAYAALADIVRGIPDDAVVLLDGLVASTASDVLLPQASRLRLVVLVHMPLRGDEGTREGAVLAAAAAVVATSAWTRRRLLELYPLRADRLHVAEPGVDAAELATWSAGGGALLCVAAVTACKGHDVLLDALATVADQPWHCVCVGSLERDRAFAQDLRLRALARGLVDRLCFAGPRTGADLDRSYASADLLVLASRGETYGMVVTEALARGVPVLAAEVGGVTEALGHGADAIRPGLLVPPGDPTALAGALRAWLGDPELRARLRQAARERRASLRRWSTTAAVLGGVLEGVSR
jgi:glycosyltransferase involved in cell wall biosynthesis